MTGRKSIYKAGRAQTERERALREHGKAVNRLKRWCEKHHVTLKDFSEADAEDICVVSRNDYELEDERYIILFDNDSYFLNQKDYEKWKNHQYNIRIVLFCNVLFNDISSRLIV